MQHLSAKSPTSFGVGLFVALIHIFIDIIVIVKKEKHCKYIF